MIVNLKDLGDSGCEVSYSCDVNIVGKLATFGERIMRAKSKDVVEKFTVNLQKKLSTLEA
jgi:carbon monoxide dehydrogenase subunit G